METRRKSGIAKFSPEEKLLLLALLDKHKAVLGSRKNDIDSVNERHRKWGELTNEFNANTTHATHTTQYLIAEYRNMKPSNQSLRNFLKTISDLKKLQGEGSSAVTVSNPAAAPAPPTTAEPSVNSECNDTHSTTLLTLNQAKNSVLKKQDTKKKKPKADTEHVADITEVFEFQKQMAKEQLMHQRQIQELKMKQMRETTDFEKIKQDLELKFLREKYGLELANLKYR